jgi:hypothetical protein
LTAIGVGEFALVTTEFLPVGLLPQIARDMGVTAVVKSGPREWRLLAQSSRWYANIISELV